MKLTPITTPKVVKSLFPTLLWDVPTKGKDIYLTFDDGPTPEITNWVLETLKKYDAKATFFCIGKNVEQHPNIFKNITKNGHAIGNHTFNHLKGWKTNTKDYLEDTMRCDQILKTEIKKSSIVNHKSPINNRQSSIINHQSSFSNLFRPPYGQITPKQIKKLQEQAYKIVMWSVLSVDWDKNVSEQKCYNNVVKNAVSGDIVVFHDSVKASKNMQYALPRVLEHFTNKGFTFKRIPV